MIAVIAWKEWRQQYVMVVALLALAGIGVTATALSMPREWADRTLDSSIAGVAGSLLFLLAATQGLVTGAMLFAGETEDRTQDFLDQHAGLRSPVWRAKMLSGLSIAGCTSSILGGLFVALRIGDVLALAAFVCVALDAMVWSSACSVGRKTTFGAIGVSLAVYLLVGSLLFSFATVVLPETIVIPLRILLSIVVLGISWRLYCSADFERIRLGPIQFRRPHWLMLPIWLTAPLWQTWVRRKGTLASMAAGSIAIGFLSAFNSSLLFWPLGTFLLGCVAGWAAFADEHADGAERFLGDQRFPRVRLWLGKTLPLFAVAVVGTSLAMVIAYVIVDHRHSGGIPQFGPYWPGNLVWWGYILAFVVQGFGIALFASQQTRKLPVAIFLTLAIGLPIAGLWYPSMLLGLRLWHVWLVPVVLALATLWLLPRWTSGRLHDRGGIVRLCGLVAAAALWIAGSLWYRVAQYPDSGPPFDSQAYWTMVLQTPNTNGSELKIASAKLESRLEEAASLFPHHVAKDGQEAHERKSNSNWWWDRRQRVLREGLSDEEDKLPEFMGYVFAGDWAEQFKRAALAAPDRLQPIGDYDSREFAKTSAPINRAIDVYLIRFLLQLKRNETDAALDDLEVALAAIRHGVHRGWGAPLGGFLGENNSALAIVDSVLDRAVTDGKFRAGLVRVLARHDELWPNYSDNLKSAYYAFDRREYRDSMNDHLQVAFREAPWERVRYESLRNRTFSALLEQAKEGRFTVGGDPFAPFDEYFGKPPLFGWANLRAFRRENYAQLLWNMQFLNSDLLGLQFNSLMHDTSSYAAAIAKIRFLRLGVAAIAYEADHGRPISSLEELVPEYLQRLPENPYLGRTFACRISQGNEPVGWGSVGAPRTHQTLPGQLVIFATNERSEILPVPMPIRK